MWVGCDERGGRASEAGGREPAAQVSTSGKIVSETVQLLHPSYRKTIRDFTLDQRSKQYQALGLPGHFCTAALVMTRTVIDHISDTSPNFGQNGKFCAVLSHRRKEPPS
jgi:hypothetical protein